MQTDTGKRVQFEKLAQIPIPEGLTEKEGLTACFLDGIKPATDSSYRSAALVGQVAGDGLGMVGLEYLNGVPNCVILQAPPVSPATPWTWPAGSRVDAACGVSGGRVAFAVRDGNIVVLQVHNSPASAQGGWDLDCTIVFDDNVGKVQQMLERDGVIYGFTKDLWGANNAFFSVEVKDGATPGVNYYGGSPALGFFYKVKGLASASNVMMRRIAFHDDNVYALEDTNDHVLCASMADGTVTRLRLADDPQTPTWGIVAHESLNKAYCAYTVDVEDAGELVKVMPYTVAETRLLPAPHPIDPPAQICCPAIDQSLGLLYLVGLAPIASAPPPHLQAIDVATDKPLLVIGSPPPEVDIISMPSAWADSVNNIFYLSGLGRSPELGSGLEMGVYRVSLV